MVDDKGASIIRLNFLVFEIFPEANITTTSLIWIIVILDDLNWYEQSAMGKPLCFLMDMGPERCYHILNTSMILPMNGQFVLGSYMQHTYGRLELTMDWMGLHNWLLSKAKFSYLSFCYILKDSKGNCQISGKTKIGYDVMNIPGEILFRKSGSMMNLIHVAPKSFSLSCFELNTFKKSFHFFQNREHYCSMTFLWKLR